MASRAMAVGIVSDPGLAEEVGAAVADRLPDALKKQIPGGGDWHVHHRTHPLATGQQSRLADIAAAELPVDPAWDITVLLTDLPRREGTDPVDMEANAARRLAVVSLPALGGIRLNRRAERVIVAAIAQLLDRSTTTSRSRARPRFRGRLRLLVGMVRANRPWQLFFGLSRALAGVFGTAALAMLNSIGWQLGDSLSAGRLTTIAALSVAALTAWLIVDHELWERPSSARAKELARLYNTTTAVTLTIGVVCLYLGMFAVLAAVSFLVFDQHVLQATLGHRPTWADCLGIAWFSTSAAMVGGALGSGLENDRVVQQAAYGERQRQRSKRHQQDSDQP